MKIQYEIDINAPVENVYEYYINPDNINEAWPQDIVKDQNHYLHLVLTKVREGSEMKINGNNTHVRHEIEFELPTTGKITSFLSGDGAKNKIQEGLLQAI